MKMPPTQIDFIRFEGGLNLVSPPLSMPPGMLRETQNYEIGAFGGYKRIDGYERFDGRPSPSAAVYTLLACTITGSFTSGQTITGLTSGATGVVIASEAAAVIYTKKTGAFISGEAIQVAAVTQATSTATPVQDGALTTLLHAQYRNLAADAYRSDITAVTGSGAILGLKYLGSTLYAFRANAGATATVLWKSSATGWTAVAFGEEISFSNANTSVGEADVLTQGAVTATIARVVLQTGTLASGVNTGRLILTGRAGGNFAGGAATSTGGGALTLSGAQTAITLAPGGRFRMVNYNFGAGLRIYGCDGVNRGFEFDGTTFVPLTTGMTTDTPAFVAAHKNHLFFGFSNSLQHSGTGFPYQWTPISGASELNLGAAITNLLPQPGDATSGGAMMCATRNRTYLLYGSSTANWNLVTLAQDAGSLAHTAQNIGGTYFLDDRGISSLATTQAFGNFASATVSDFIRPWLVENKGAVVDSCIVREKNQYRLIFTGGRAIYMTLVGNKISGFMPQLYADPIVIAESTELTDGSESVFYGDTAGFVYQDGAGTSFDGDAVESYLTFVFNHAKGPRTLKQYRKVVLEVSGTGYGVFYVGADLGYSSDDIPQISLESVAASLSSGVWDTGVWDVGVWDGRILLPAEKELSGIAENIGLRLTQSSDYEAALTFYGALIHYTPRRLMR